MRIKFLANIIVTVLILGINGAFGSLESDVEWLLNRVKKIEDKGNMFKRLHLVQ